MKQALFVAIGLAVYAFAWMLFGDMNRQLILEGSYFMAVGAAASWVWQHFDKS